MKLPHLRPRPAAKTAEPDSRTAELASASLAAPALLVLTYKTGLPEQEFSAQAETPECRQLRRRHPQLLHLASPRPP